MPTLKILTTSKLHDLDLMIIDLIKEFGDLRIKDIRHMIFDEITLRYGGEKTKMSTSEKITVGELVWDCKQRVEKKGYNFYGLVKYYQQNGIFERITKNMIKEKK